MRGCAAEDGGKSRYRVDSDVGCTPLDPIYGADGDVASGGELILPQTQRNSRSFHVKPERGA